MRARVVRFEDPGLILATRRKRFTVAYGEILTAERLPERWRGLLLHTRSTEPIRLRRLGRTRELIEAELRRRCVRVVDHWGAMITPTLEDFEAELARGRGAVRQSSDNA